VRGAIAGLLGLGRLSTPEDQREDLQAMDAMRVYREASVVRFATDVEFDAVESSPILGPLLGVKCRAAQDRV
jgi:hypothetical protein